MRYHVANFSSLSQRQRPRSLIRDRSLIQLHKPAPTSFGTLRHLKKLRRQLLLVARSSDKSSIASDPRTKTVPVTELVLLLQVQEETDVEDSEELLDSLWSLQYMTGPGILCAFAGRVVRPPVAEGAKVEVPGFSHAVHYRFANAQAAAKFQQHSRVRGMVETKLRPVCKHHMELIFEAQVSAQLEDMFRRGSDWESGVELVLLLQGQDTGLESAAASYCQQLSAIAESSLAGAVQSTSSTLDQAAGSTGLACSSSKEVRVVMSRFERRAQMEMFLKLPPCENLISGDSEYPVRLLLNVAFSIAEAQTQRSTSPGANRLA